MVGSVREIGSKVLPCHGEDLVQISWKGHFSRRDISEHKSSQYVLLYYLCDVATFEVSRAICVPLCDFNHGQPSPNLVEGATRLKSWHFHRSWGMNIAITVVDPQPEGTRYCRYLLTISQNTGSSSKVCIGIVNLTTMSSHALGNERHSHLLWLARVVGRWG
jgi:hypothetical protein